MNVSASEAENAIVPEPKRWNLGLRARLLLAFFGISGKEVHGEWSIFDLGHYMAVYLAATVLAITPLAAFVFLNGRAWLKNRTVKRTRDRRIAKDLESL